MKKLLMAGAVLLVFGAGSALAQPTYQFAEAGSKNFVSETTISVGDPISLDLYLSNVGAPQNSGGAWIDFTGSTARISYVSGGRCLLNGSEGCTGPWQNDAGLFINEPDPGTGPIVGAILYVVANLSGAAPDVDGDLIVGTVTLECTAEGDAIVELTTIPGVSTWTPINDTDVVPGSLLIHQVETCLNDADCDDGNFCNGAETCDIGGTNQCLPGSPQPNGTACDDGNACTENDVCTGGVCGGSAVVCDDANVCTADTCDPGTGCVYTPVADATPCDDGDACTEDDVCTGGVCGGSPLVCDDANDCTDDTCDPGTGCVYTPLGDGAPCDDGNDCTENDACSGGICVADNVADGTACDDGVFCNGEDTCSAGACTEHAGDPCAPDEICDEATDTCYMVACEVVIEPSSTTLFTWEEFQFASPTSGECETPCYTWEISIQGSIGSTIDQNGFYTAGGSTGMDVIQVTDPCNGSISNTATVHVVESPCIVFCANDESGQLNIVETYGASGSEVTVTVEMNSAPNAVESLGFEVAYNPECLEYTGNWERGGCIVNWNFFNVTNPAPGVVRVGAFTTVDPVQQGESCNVVRLTFDSITPDLDSPDEAVRLDLEALVDDIAGWSRSPGFICGGCSCDVNGDGIITPQDALCAFQKYLGICPTSCGPCEGICGDVNGDGHTTPADALCIFQEYLGIGCEYCN